jgi:hypothetical protein
LVDKKQQPGVYTEQLNTGSLPQGTYIIKAAKNGVDKKTIEIIKH